MDGFCKNGIKCFQIHCKFVSNKFNGNKKKEKCTKIDPSRVAENREKLAEYTNHANILIPTFKRRYQTLLKN